MNGQGHPSTIGCGLERQRLEHRARRVERVLHALDDRVAERRRHGNVPPGLREAVRDFEHELHTVRARLAGLASA